MPILTTSLIPVMIRLSTRGEVPALVRLQVRELAQKKNLTQKALAEQSGVTVQLLNRYWNNNIQRVDLEELNKIAIALGVEPGDLIVSGNRREDDTPNSENAA